jgi:hypothetical protein
MRSKDTIIGGLALEPSDVKRDPIGWMSAFLEVLIDIRDVLSPGRRGVSAVEIINAGDIRG